MPTFSCSDSTMKHTLDTLKHAATLAVLALATLGNAALAQPTFGNPSPTAGSSMRMMSG